MFLGGTSLNVVLVMVNEGDKREKLMINVILLQILYPVGRLVEQSALKKTGLLTHLELVGKCQKRKRAGRMMINYV